jgi:RNA polymerase sigma factor (sigma-70 family)
MADYSRLSDSELLTRCLADDAAAWETLVRRYQRLVASVTFKYGLTQEDAADVLQAVFLTLFQQLDTLREQTKLSSWIITVAVRESWKLRQRSGKTASLDAPEWAAANELADEAHLRLEADILKLQRQHIVRRAIELLPKRCRELLNLLFYSETPLSYAELSQQIGIPIASIGPTRLRCLDKLKINLAQENFF